MLEFGVEIAERLEDVVLAVGKSFSRCLSDFGSNSGETSEVADPLDTGFISEVQALEWNPFVRVNNLEERESIQLGAFGIRHLSYCFLLLLGFAPGLLGAMLL